ncbi:GNAT family N-acetyltransferase [Labrenzia sp. PHM005]|uniref:GNAT family N-acetyltransferase n=1 Tax=Labrenzia sp. PHM005 TaxID=2590016 RepID=UPI00114040A9|nr:GNAT family N-acetyltransferase [Labrenzia sp. PHM005]QDG75111.1 GNAT family N-acetyltransferase [Labrenzia sp. PHM005]
MPPEIHLETDRLICRGWQDEDLDPFAEMCADPEVMRYFPEPMTRETTAALIGRAKAKQERDGFCFGPVETKADGEFLGFVGLSIPAYEKPLPFDPCVEIGWRLKRSAWGKGYASEAAGAWLRFGFETIGLKEIVSFTSNNNLPSQKVMERIGMRRDPADDFVHPMLEPDHPLAAHVLYRLDRQRWVGGQDKIESR